MATTTTLSNGDMTGRTQQTSHGSGPFKLLSLDGGGVKGLSSLIILQAIMKKVQEIEDGQASKLSNGASGASSSAAEVASERRPVDYFDLAAGTSTGGLIALILFRLNMKTSEAIGVYEKLAEDVFCPRIGSFKLHLLGPVGHWLGDALLTFKAVFFDNQFSHKPLVAAIDQVVEAHGDAEDKQLKSKAKLMGKGNGQMIMCATLADQGESILFRNYSVPLDPGPVSSAAKSFKFEEVTIGDACRATSAAPTYLPEINIQGLNFWDGGLLNNNPIDQVWDNRYDLTPESRTSPHVSCILSLGCSHQEYSATLRPTYVWRWLNTVSKLASFVTNTEAKHRDFQRNMDSRNARKSDSQVGYFRFNASTGTDAIDLDDFDKMNKLREYTEQYLRRPDVQDQIEKCARLLAK